MRENVRELHSSELFVQTPQIRIIGIVSLLLLGVACDTAKPSTPTLKNEGEVCVRDDECSTGLCEGAPGTQTSCTRKCTGGCQANEICEQLTVGRFSCVKDRGGLCSQCVLDSDCPYPADKCLVIDGKGLCGRDCAFNQNCPTSYRCLQGLGTDGKAKAQQCTPASGSCTCTATTAGQMVSCTASNSSGTCSGFRTCDGVQGFNGCTAKIPEPELCNGLDDDCDGKIDEIITPLTCGVGACKNTVDSCVDGGITTCVPLPTSAERCNSVDDDCDGLVDNLASNQTDVSNCGKCGTVCALANANQKCASGVCGIQACNTGFGDCNHLVEDGCEINTQNDSNNCGMCGKTCTAPGSTGTCVAGACNLVCAAGFIDLDRDSSNGCEYACTKVAGPDLPDVLFKDSDCDGFDGEPANGIFVSDTDGDDLNAGTMASPVLSIQRGVDLAVANGLRDVYVAKPFSEYVGPVNLTNVRGKIIAGGYAVASPRWSRAATNGTTVVGGNPSLVMNASHGTVVQYISFRAADATGVDGYGNGRSSYGATVINTADAGFQHVTIQAGNGAPGVVGSTGSSLGPQGLASNGGPGGLAVEDESSDLCNRQHPGQPTVGSPGTSTCGGRSGGLGGIPGFRDGAGSDGQTGDTGTLAGFGQPAHTYGAYSAGATGKNGDNGATGADGTRSAALGTLTIAGYLPPLGGPGGVGNLGNGGGGGGGAGGGCRYVDYFGIDKCCTFFGSAGGGGGAGGCGGSGGGAGGSGGASISLAMWNSSARALEVFLRRGTGGIGGMGGIGGYGSAGGVGGTSPFPSSVPRLSAGVGGVGGNGGAGGRGGTGAGGTGGSAIGYAHDAASRINVNELEFRNGTRGLGGTGGSTNAGPDGQVIEEQSF